MEAIGQMAEPIDASADSGAWTTERRAALHRFARRVTHNPGLADDVLHDVLATVLTSGRRFPNVADEDRFVRRAIINRTIDLSRRRRSETTALHRWHAAHRDDTPATEHPHDMTAALTELSPRARAVLALRFGEDLSYDDIAERLGGSPARHRMTVSRAIRKLRTLLTKDHGHE